MKPEDIIKALRCSTTPGKHDCDGCPYLVIEKLSGEEAEIFGTSELESCDCDKIALDAAELLEAYRATRHTPEECAAAFEELDAYRDAEHTVLVRCKACKFSKPWYGSEELGNEKVLCRFHLVDQMSMPADGYCNYGELKEQEGQK